MKTSLPTISFILFSLSGALMISGCKDKNDKPSLPPPVRVTVMPVSPSEETPSNEYSATVSSENSTTVSFSVPGTIQNLYAREGQKVAKGQVLGRLKAGDYQSSLNIAEAELAEATDAYQRLKKLHDANALPDIKWVEIQQKVKQAENATQIARRALEDATLKAPATGVINRKFANEGQTILSVEPIYEIISTDGLNVDVSVSENAIGSFKVGQKARVSFESPSLPSVEGKVSSKTVAADPVTRSFTVKIAIPNPEGNILPGMIANVIFESISDANDAIAGTILPAQSVLLNEDNRYFVWVVKNGIALRKFVETDQLAPGGVLVTSGLEKNDSVIVAGMQKVGTGTRVIALTK